MDELDLARELADIADEISMGHFARNPQVTMKKDGTPVTEADRRIEELLRKRIGEQFPGHGLLGEEEGLQGNPNGPIWVIDPIDGTANFVAGIPVFATLIGLRVNGRTDVGVVSAPALGERYEAAFGDGARMNGAAIAVSDVSELAAATVCFASLRRMQQHGYGYQAAAIIASCRRDRGFGDFWGHMLVARGAVDTMAEPALEAWDVIPLEIIVKEAGGKITNFKGDPYPESKITGGPAEASCLSTNGALHPQLVNALSKES